MRRAECEEQSAESIALRLSWLCTVPNESLLAALQLVLTAMLSNLFNDLSPTWTSLWHPVPSHNIHLSTPFSTSVYSASSTTHRLSSPLPIPIAFQP